MHTIQAFLTILLCAMFWLSFILFLAFAAETTIYDNDWNVEERIRDGTIYDRNWNVRGRMGRGGRKGGRSC